MIIVANQSKFKKFLWFLFTLTTHKCTHVCAHLKILGRHSFFPYVWGLFYLGLIQISQIHVFLYTTYIAFLFGKPNIIEVKSYKIIFSGNRLMKWNIEIKIIYHDINYKVHARFVYRKSLQETLREGEKSFGILTKCKCQNWFNLTWT